MIHEKFYIGSAGFAQLGCENYGAKALIEWEVLKAHLESLKFMPRITAVNGTIVWEKQPYEGSYYHEIVLYIPEDVYEKKNAQAIKLVNDLESVDLEAPELMDRMDVLYKERIPEVKVKMVEKAVTLTQKARELEEAGAVVMLPEEVDELAEGSEEKIEKAEKQSTFRFISEDEITEEMIFDSVVPACCIYGCEVEPDGVCPHGNKSVLLYHGLI